LPIESKYRGAIRDKDVMIYNYDGTLIYNGAAANIVKSEFNKLFHDIDLLIERKMTINEVFYFASMIHFVFTHIHPFADGNGRTSRLVEKWFLAEKLGEMAWFIQSEKLYQKRIASYYKNLNVGEKYDSLNYEKCIPFLLMLPMSLNIK
jgi:Fic family protein